MLALLVVVSHMEQQFSPAWLHEILGPLHLGMLAVLLFFVVSGYVIYEACDIFYSRRPSGFLLNRFFRIYPPFVFALLISLFVHFVCYRFNTYGPVFQSPSDVLGYVSFKSIFLNLTSLIDDRVPNSKENYYLFVRYVWAIVVEVQFYLVVAAFLYIKGKLPHQKQPGFVWILLATAMLYGAHISLKVQYFKFLDYAPYFLLGISIYRLSKQNKESRFEFLEFMASLALSIHAFYIQVFSSESFSWFGVVIIGGLFSTFVFLAAYKRTSGGGNLKKMDNKLGDLTYPLYLNHYTIEVAVFAFIGSKSMETMMVAIISSILLAWVATISVEPLTRRVRDKIRGSRIS